MIGIRRVSLAALCAAFAFACGDSGRGGDNTGGTSNGGGAGRTSSGGNSGATSTGGSSGATSSACVGLTATADGSSTLIDDFEDHDANIIDAEGRAGGWWWSGDGGCTLTPTTLAPEAPSTGNASNYDLHLTGTGCTDWGANTGFSFNAHDAFSCAYDAGVYDGISFWAQGDGVSLHVAVATSSTIPTTAGGDGTCPDSTGAKTCFDSFAKEVPLTAAWTQYHFAWTELSQGGWGPAVAWDATKIAQISFGIAKSVTADFALDDVRFYKGTVDTTPPAPGGAGGAGGGGSSSAGAGG